MTPPPSPDSRGAFRATVLIVAVVAGALLLWWGLTREPSLPERAPPAGRIPGDTLDEETTGQLLVHLEQSGLIRYDRVAIVLAERDLDVRFDWPEHPDGEVVVTTNGRGLRESAPVPVPAAGRRVLVLGDSQTFGLVETDATWPNVLERLLVAHDGGADDDVVNAGVPGTGPYEYLGSLRRLADLEPDVVVVAIFVGNDFVNALRFADFFAKREVAPLSGSTQARIDAVRRKSPSQLANGFNQAYDFVHRPKNAGVALEAALDDLDQVANICGKLGSELLVVLIPTATDVDRDHDTERIDEILAGLEMSLDEYGINRKVAARFQRGLEARDVRVVDLHDVLVADPRPLYWRYDHHLNLAGHEAVAHALEEPVRELLEGRR